MALAIGDTAPNFELVNQHGEKISLASYKDIAPAVQYAHPTVEHFTPLFITLGAATDTSVAPETLIDGYFMGLAKRSILVA